MWLHDKESIVFAEIEKGFSTISKASEQNVEMKLFLKLILHKMRLALLLRYAPEMRKELEEKLSKEDTEFIKGILKEKGQGISSQTLLALLEAYQHSYNAFIPELPLELALVKIMGKDK